MGTVNLRILWQGSQFVEAVKHHRRRAFKEPPAAKGEKRIASKDSLYRWYMVI